MAGIDWKYSCTIFYTLLKYSVIMLPIVYSHFYLDLVKNMRYIIVLFYLKNLKLKTLTKTTVAFPQWHLNRTLVT